MASRARHLVVAASAMLAFGLVLSGCASSAPATHSPSTSASPIAPAANAKSFVHKGFSITKMWHEALSGKVVPEAIFTSIGPVQAKPGAHTTGQTENVQVLSWDRLANQWDLIFDAFYDRAASWSGSGNGRVGDPPNYQGTASTLFTLHNRTTNVQVGFVHLLAGEGEQLVISGTTPDLTSDMTDGHLAILSFGGGLPTWEYAWQGWGPLSWRTTNHSVVLEATHWNNTDGTCCAARVYSTTIGRGPNTGYDWPIEDLSSTLGWFGFYAAPRARGHDAPLVVDDTLDQVRVDKQLRHNDVILAVENAPSTLATARTADGNKVADALNGFTPGQVAVLKVQRGNRTLIVRVRAQTAENAQSYFGINATDPAHPQQDEY
jgi:hypothetical protein